MLVFMLDRALRIYEYVSGVANENKVKAKKKKIIIIIYSLGIVCSFENVFHARVHGNDVILPIHIHVNKRNECVS